ncbi:GTPase, partial [Tremellales sp. Uapishka_1]
MSIAVPCLRCLARPWSQAVGTSSYRQFATSSRLALEEVQDDDFDRHVGELHRRKRKIEEKRRQKGADFIDHLTVTIRGGKGGSGSAAFDGARSGSLGPPSGGNGGPGGSVYLQTSPHITSLSSVSKRLIAAQGGNGAGSWKHGRRGLDILVKVPVGTVITEIKREGEEERVWNEEKALGLDREERVRRRRERWFLKHPSGEIQDGDFELAEDMLRKEGKFLASTPSFEELAPLELDIDRPIIEPILLAKGGQGGLGNPHFHNISPAATHRAPRLASRGTLPPTCTFTFELKLLADVGLVGFPNVGKSTILRALTGRRAEVANYSFTTLNPQIGVVRCYQDGSWGGKTLVEESYKERVEDEQARERGEYKPLPRMQGMQGDQIEKMRFTISDNPGLLPSAAQNYGLGHSFLRSIERSLALCYVLDLTRTHPEQDLLVLRKELEDYKAGLSEKGRVVVVNKGDEVDEAVGRERVEKVKGEVERLNRENKEKLEVIVISGKFGLGLERLVAILVDSVEEAREKVKEGKEKL